MRDRMKREKARLAAQKYRAKLAAQEYMEGIKLRRDSMQLSDKSLGNKFGCSEWAVNRVKHGLPTNALDAEDKALIRLLVAEKAEADRMIPRFTKAYLGYKHQVSRKAVERELDVMGFVSPYTKGESKGAVA